VCPFIAQGSFESYLALLTEACQIAVLKMANNGRNRLLADKLTLPMPFMLALIRIRSALQYLL